MADPPDECAPIRSMSRHCSRVLHIRIGYFIDNIDPPHYGCPWSLLPSITASRPKKRHGLHNRTPWSNLQNIDKYLAGAPGLFHYLPYVSYVISGSSSMSKAILFNSNLDLFAMKLSSTLLAFEVKAIVR